MLGLGIKQKKGSQTPSETPSKSSNRCVGEKSGTGEGREKEWEARGGGREYEGFSALPTHSYCGLSLLCLDLMETSGCTVWGNG